jgi:hypothetical protein
LYAHYLHRPADPVGLQNDVPFLANGGTVEQLASLIAGSPEYFQTRALSNIDVFVTEIFADAGISFVSNRAALDDELRNGLSRTAFAAQVLSLDAYRINLLQSFYLQFLDRPLDPQGQATWDGLLASGQRDEVIIAGIVADPRAQEFFLKTAP